MKPSDVGGTETDSPHSPTSQDNNLTTTLSQQGIKDWDGIEHPFEGLYNLIEDALCMLIRRRKKTVARFTERIISLLPFYEGQVRGSKGRLSPVATYLKAAISSRTTGDMENALERALEIVTGIIWDDENAKFPGCRNENGVIVLGGGEK
jgi:hypothetical protein